MRLKVFEAFAGIGTQTMALRRLNIPHDVVGIAEVDTDALISYAAINNCSFDDDKLNEEAIEADMRQKNVAFDFKKGTSKLTRMNKKRKRLLVQAHAFSNNYGDISLIDPVALPDFDLFTYSFPCQDLSVAGKRMGLSKGTRSGLLYECQKIIEAKRPRYLLMENVKALVGTAFKPAFDDWVAYLDTLGYTTFWQVLNSKDYGVPQNRERVFAVSILNATHRYTFKPSFPLEKRIKDVLEPTVSESFYLDKPFKLVYTKNQAAELLMKGHATTKRVQNEQMLCPTLTTMQGGHREPKIIVAQTKKTKTLPTLNLTATELQALDKPFIVASRGRYLSQAPTQAPASNATQQLEANKLGTSNCLTTVQKDNLLCLPPETMIPLEEQYRIRKLTPLECWRLMGIEDTDFYKAQAVVSNSQLYKQAGNAIVVDVLCVIFEHLFI